MITGYNLYLYVLSAASTAVFVREQLYIYNQPHSFPDSPLPILDTDTAWNFDNAPSKLGALGEEGRETYRRLNTLDFVFPFLYAPTFAMIMGIATAGMDCRARAALILLPIAAGIFDVIENVEVRALLMDFMQGMPNGEAAPSNNAGKFYGVGYLSTDLKFLFLGLTVAALLLVPGLRHLRDRCGAARPEGAVGCSSPGSSEGGATTPSSDGLAV